MVSINPQNELVVSATAVALVVSIFSNALPPLVDVRADEPGNVNTHKSTKMAAISAMAVVGTIALLSKSPTVATVGFAATLFETWKMHFANYRVNGTQENAANSQMG